MEEKTVLDHVPEEIGSSAEISVDDRRKKILELLAVKGKIRVSELSRQFGISDVTIRLDLGELEKAGLLERVHGGAVSTSKAYFNMDFSERISRFEEEKRNIARTAAAMVKDNDTLIINSGTTTYFIAQELKKRKALTVVTNSVMIAQELAHLQNFTVILLGGNYNYQYQFTYGDDTIRQTDFVSGWDQQFGRTYNASSSGGGSGSFDATTGKSGYSSGRLFKNRQRKFCIHSAS